MILIRQLHLLLLLLVLLLLVVMTLAKASLTSRLAIVAVLSGVPDCDVGRPALPVIGPLRFALTIVIRQLRLLLLLLPPVLVLVLVLVLLPVLVLVLLLLLLLLLLLVLLLVLSMVRSPPPVLLCAPELSLLSFRERRLTLDRASAIGRVSVPDLPQVCVCAVHVLPLFPVHNSVRHLSFVPVGTLHTVVRPIFPVVSAIMTCRCETVNSVALSFPD
jgi:hypothetical protein